MAQDEAALADRLQPQSGQAGELDRAVVVGALGGQQEAGDAGGAAQPKDEAIRPRAEAAEVEQEVGKAPALHTVKGVLAIAAEQAGVQHRLEGLLPLVRGVQDDPATAVEYRIQIVVGQAEQLATGGAMGLVADVGLPGVVRCPVSTRGKPS
ncbi:hypothetical protein [Streptomyces sp. NPDC048106]|uniref:hypothetical protein n=1 Tax=Streptomyces sp. NPDC048106 TaxID=3155750 RepID=UPI003451F0D2